MKTTTTLAALALLASAATATAGDSMTQKIHVDTAGGKVIVRVAIDNNTGKDVYVPKAVYEDKELWRREFAIRESASGKEIDYAGRMVKRGPITMADYVLVKPGQKKSNSIDITNTYDFQPGQHTYVLAYTGTLLHDAKELAAPPEFKAMPVSFIFRK